MIGPTSKTAVDWVKAKLEADYKMFDLGVPTDFLGIELLYVNARDSSIGKAYCWMHQKRYTLEVLKRFGMSDCKGAARLSMLQALGIREYCYVGSR